MSLISVSDGLDMREEHAKVPEELRLKKVELNRAEPRVHNFIEFVAAGRATPGLADALAQAEGQVKALTTDVASMESAKLFTPPPRAWIADRVTKLNEVLAARTQTSALALRRLTGAVTLTPKRPEVGRPYTVRRCRFEGLNFLAEPGSNLSQWWTLQESNPSATCMRSMRLRAYPLARIARGSRVLSHHAHPLTLTSRANPNSSTSSRTCTTELRAHAVPHPPLRASRVDEAKGTSARSEVESPGGAAKSREGAAKPNPSRFTQAATPRARTRPAPKGHSTQRAPTCPSLRPQGQPPRADPKTPEPKRVPSTQSTLDCTSARRRAVQATR